MRSIRGILMVFSMRLGGSLVLWVRWVDRTFLSTTRHILIPIPLPTAYVFLLLPCYFEYLHTPANPPLQDPLNARFGQDLARLSRDLLFDSDGKLAYKPELWNDIRKVILPTLIEKVGYVPIPRIEYTDDGLDLVVENLTLSGPNLFPKYVVALLVSISNLTRLCLASSPSKPTIS